VQELVDTFGRVVSDVRISVTDRCNFRCQYCMPAEGLPWLERSEILSFEEIERVLRVLVGLGVRTLRLTGGEPLVRRDLPRLVAMLRPIEGLEEIALTTNGYLLERDAEALVQAGVDRFNVSVDSLQRDRFFEMTRRDALPQVLRGLEKLASLPLVHPIKINAVALRGFTEEELIPFARLAREGRFEVRFIEFMPLEAGDEWSDERVLSGEEIRAAIDEVFPLVAEPRAESSTARTFRFADAPGRIGFINPVSEPFCGDCNRIRITADGHLRTCLFSLKELDLRGPIRDGASDIALGALVRGAVWRKEAGHLVGRAGFERPERTMSAIGG
jgi:cyclic pyranopterin phosphate synthase